MFFCYCSKVQFNSRCGTILIQAVALHLGAVPIGAFYDDQVQAALYFTPDHEPLYIIPVGHPQK